MSVGSHYEIFECAKQNQLKRVRELLDVGLDVNVRDDINSTPLHYACSNGAKQTMELLVERGANLNAQNDKGLTPLHTLITKRYDAVALWLVRQGADLHIQDKKGHAPRDYALQWFQKELDDVANGKFTKAEEDERQRKKLAEEKKQQEQQPQTNKQQPKEVVEDFLKIRLGDASYRTVRVTPEDTATSIMKTIADKLSMPQYVQYLDIFENVKGETRKVGSGENIFEIKKKWPLILATGDGQATVRNTKQHCEFNVKLKTGAPADVVSKYTSAVQS